MIGEPVVSQHGFCTGSMHSLSFSQFFMAKSSFPAVFQSTFVEGRMSFKCLAVLSYNWMKVYCRNLRRFGKRDIVYTCALFENK